MTMSSNNHVDVRESERRKLKGGVDAPASRKNEPSQPVPKPQLSKPPTNHLLACYLAHEFLSHGTLLGRRFDKHRAELKTKAEPYARQVYANVSGLLKDDGVHLPGIVNPSQLTRWIGIWQVGQCECVLGTHTSPT